MTTRLSVIQLLAPASQHSACRPTVFRSEYHLVKPSGTFTRSLCPPCTIYRRQCFGNAAKLFLILIVYMTITVLSQTDQSPYHRRTLPVCTGQPLSSVIAQTSTDLLLLFLFLRCRSRSTTTTTATTTTRSRGSSSSTTTTRRNLSCHVTAISRHTTHTRTDESLADPSAINCVPNSVSRLSCSKIQPNVRR